MQPAALGYLPGFAPHLDPDRGADQPRPDQLLDEPVGGGRGSRRSPGRSDPGAARIPPRCPALPAASAGSPRDCPARWPGHAPGRRTRRSAPAHPRSRSAAKSPNVRTPSRRSRVVSCGVIQQFDREGGEEVRGSPLRHNPDPRGVRRRPTASPRGASDGPGGVFRGERAVGDPDPRAPHALGLQGIQQPQRRLLFPSVVAARARGRGWRRSPAGSAARRAWSPQSR